MPRGAARNAPDASSGMRRAGLDCRPRVTASVLPEDLQVPEELSRRKVRKQLLFLTGVVLVVVAVAALARQPDVARAWRGAEGALRPWVCGDLSDGVLQAHELARELPDRDV